MDPITPDDRARTASTGIVLAGAAALGAYEVGVLSHLFERVVPKAGGVPELFCGTSAGGINASALAALADQPTVATRLLTRAWGELELEKIVRPSSVEIFAMMLDLGGAPLNWRRALQVRTIRGGLLDGEPIARLVARIPFERIPEQIGRGRLRGLAVSVTRVSDGAAIVFHADGQGAPRWRAERNMVPIATRLTAEHVRASAAIPLLFPAVRIDSELYCDGGLRQMVPLSPAVHMGAERVIVINPLPAVRRAPLRAPALTSPLYLAGKALNALFADRVEVDLEQLTRTTAILRAGQRRFGPGFERAINDQLVADGAAPLRTIDALSIEPSQDLGMLAAEYVSGPKFARCGRGPAAWLLRRIADGDPGRMGDLLAYLMFDGGFTADLIELGRADARAREDALGALLGTEERVRVA